MSEYIMYLRKSRQDNPEETVEEVLFRHEIQLQEYAMKNFHYRIKEEDIYREVVSGETIEDRPEMKKVLKLIESSTVKGVLVIEPQRLSRGDMLDCGTIVHVFRYTNTLVVTPPKTYDLTEKYDRKFFEMELSRGSDYLEYTKEILNRGRVLSRKQGNYIGSVAPYGYTKIKNGKEHSLVINEEEAQYVRMAYDLFIQGHGSHYIGEQLEAMGAKPRKAKHFTPANIRKMLRNPVYIGQIVLNRSQSVKVYEDGCLKTKRVYNPDYETVPGKHEPIISNEIFELANSEACRKARVPSSKEIRFIFAGLAKCSVCGGSLGLKIHTGREHPYRVGCLKKKYCTNTSILYEDFIDLVVNALKEQIQDFEVQIETNVYKEAFETQSLLESLTKRLEKTDEKMGQLCQYLEEGMYTPDMFVKRRDTLIQEKDELQKAVREARKKMSGMKDIKEKTSSLHEALNLLRDDSISPRLKNTFLKKIIKVIYFSRINDEIVLKVVLR